MRAIHAALVCGMALSALPAFAQPADTTWQLVVPVEGDRGEVRKMIVTASGNVVVGGALTQPVDFRQGEANDAWLAMYTPDGGKIWSSQFGGDLRDEIQDVVEDSDGSLIVSGWRDSFFRQSGSSQTLFVTRFSQTGEQIWDVVIPNEDVVRPEASDIMLAPDGGIILSGRSSFDGRSGTEPLIVKLTAGGHIAWMARPTISPDVKLTGGMNLMSKGVVAHFDRADVLRVSIEGIETKLQRGNVTTAIDASCVVLDLDDGAETNRACSPTTLNGFRQDRLFATKHSANFEASDPIVSKRDANGAIAWERTLPSANGDGFHDIAATADGGVVGAGYLLNGNRTFLHNWDGLLIRLDADGNEMWRRTFGGNKRDELKSVAVLADGSIIVAGFTGSQTGVQDWAPWIMRLNPQGELEGEALKELQDRQF